MNISSYPVSPVTGLFFFSRAEIFKLGCFVQNIQIWVFRAKIFVRYRVRKNPVKDKRKKKIVKEGKTSYQCECYQILKGLKVHLARCPELCRLTKRLSLCAGSWPTSAGRRQPASKVRRWNISQDAHGRISGRSGPF